jgi:hypothetical protein
MKTSISQWARMVCAAVVGFGLSAGSIRAADDANAPVPAKTNATTKSAADASKAATDETTYGWESLFDGKTLKGWKETDFAGKGEVKVEKDYILVGVGNNMTGITWTNDVPRTQYEVVLDAMRVDGSDFFCGLTFPVKKEYCSLILGGWGGGVVGISSIDGSDASGNQTSIYRSFKQNQWYHVRVRVTDEKLQVWLDEERIIDFKFEDHKMSTRLEVDSSKPFGAATWCTTGAIRNIKWRKL